MLGVNHLYIRMELGLAVIVWKSGGGALHGIL